METLTRAAIIKASTDKLVKGATAELSPGTYHVKTTVEIAGTITKGEDFEQTFWNSLPLMGMMLRAMNEAGIILGKGRVKAMVADVLKNGLTSEELLAEKELKSYVAALEEGMQDACTKVATGKTTSSLSVTEVFPEPRAVEADPVEEAVKAE